MRTMLLAGVAAAAALAAGPAIAACPEDIEAFQQRHREALAVADDARALTPDETAALAGLETAARQLYDSGEAEACAAAVSRAAALLDGALNPRAIDPDELEGMALSNVAGAELGEVDEVLIDPMTGRIAYILAEHGGVLGVGEDVYAVPWGAVRYVPGDETLMLDVDEQTLENAPRFDRRDRAPLGDRQWALAVHAYYGVAPYWQGRAETQVMAAAEADSPSDGQPRSAEANGDATPESRPEDASTAPSGTDAGEATASESRPADDESGNGDTAALESKVAELEAQQEEQAQTAERLRSMEAKIGEMTASDAHLAEQLAFVATQIGDMGRRLETLNADLQQALADGGAAAATQEDASSSASAPSSQTSDTGTDTADEPGPAASTSAESPAKAQSAEAAESEAVESEDGSKAD